MTHTTHPAPSSSSRASRHGRLASLAAVTLLALALIAGCSSGSSKSSAATTTTAASSAGATSGSGAITIKGFAFNPQSLTVKAGTKVTWTNKDGATHTATSDNGVFNTKSISPGSSASFTFTKPGTYSYHCGIHPTMTATIVVT